MGQATPALLEPTTAQALCTAIYRHPQWTDIRHLWDALVAQSPHASFFLSSDWIESWLESYGDLLQPQILIFRDATEAVGACLIVERTIFRGPFPVRCIFLNTAGEDEVEETCADFNNLLCLAGSEIAVATALSAHLNKRNPDEICATGFAPGSPLEALAAALGGRIRIERIERSYYVNLARLRIENCAYLLALRQSTRTNVRRAYKKYGNVELSSAADVSEALEMFDELIHLHQATWIARGHAGSFSSKRTVNFIQCLIRRAFSQGTILILRVKSAGQTIGILLNFVFHSKVNYYASGLCYQEDSQYSPGIVSLSAAINYCLENGYGEVDFLAGESDYKKQLATDYRNLAWTVFEKTSAKMRAINILRGLKQRSFQPIEQQ